MKHEEYLSFDPAEGIPFAKEPQRLPRRILTIEEACRIIDAIDENNPLGYRDRTILEVLYATGVRRNELRHLKVQDVDLDEELLRVDQGKGRLDRMVPLTKIACDFLKTYISDIRPGLLGIHCDDTERHKQALFVSSRGRPLDQNTLRLMLIKRARQAGIEGPVSCHVWRHSCATHLPRACLRIAWGPAARDFGCGQGGEAGAWPLQAVTADSTQAPRKRTAARRVFKEKAVWLRCFSVTELCGYAPSSRLAIQPFPRKQDSHGILRQAL